MTDIFDKLKTYGDFQREEQEFRLKKQTAERLAKGNTPASMQVANALGEAKAYGDQTGDYSKLNNLIMAGKFLDKGVGYGGDAPINPAAIQAPTATPEPAEKKPGLLGLLQDFERSLSTPAAPTPAPIVSPNPTVKPMSGYGAAVGSIEADKKGMGRQAEKNVDLNMNPKITRAETDQKNTSDLNFATPIADAKKTGENNANQKADLNKKVDQANSMTSLTDKAREILKRGDATGSIAGAGLALGKRFIGVSDASTQANTDLDVIAAGLTNNVPRMEGPQSDSDRIFYQQAAGRVGDKTIPLGDRLSALDTIDALNEKYKDINTPQKEILNNAKGLTPAEEAAALLPEENTNNVMPKKADPSSIPTAAAKHLRANPALAGAFDEKYGAGASKLVLGK